MATVKDVWNLLDRKAPFRTQMDFDNAGFLVGRGDQQVARVLVALDITPEVIREAAEKGCQLILAHHPVIWGKVGQITDETATGRKVLALIEQGIAAICAHTNLDAAEGGVNTALALRLGLRDQVPLAVDGTDEAVTLTALFDNLGKGASGAAVQNMNLMLGLAETAGLKL